MTHGVHSVVGEDSGDNVVDLRVRRTVASEAWSDGSAAPVIAVDGEHVVIDLRGAVDETRTVTIDRDANLLAATPWQIRAKRTLDVVGASLLLIAALPVLLIVAAAIKMTSRGPTFYVSNRVGKGGRTFRFYKFRSMVNGSDSMNGHLADQNEAVGPVFKIRNDPRTTPIGRWIRKFSIDEFPQLINVIKGDMSLVGPRPPTVGEVAQYSEYDRQRLLVKPGLTCIWQTRGRSDVDFDDWVRMDLDYIENWSLSMDFRLLIATVPAVLSGRGAY